MTILFDPHGIPVGAGTRGFFPVERLDPVGIEGGALPSADEPSLIGRNPVTDELFAPHPITDFLSPWTLGSGSGVPGTGTHTLPDMHIAFADTDPIGWYPFYVVNLGGPGGGYAHLAATLPSSINGVGGSTHIHQRNYSLRLRAGSLVVGQADLNPGSESSGGATVSSSLAADVGLVAGLLHHVLFIEVYNPGGVAKTIWSHGGSLVVTDLGRGAISSVRARDLLTRFVPVMDGGSVLCATDGSAVMAEVPN